MEAAAHAEHAHHEMPTSGSALTGVAVSATLHCLTGCAIGEVAGMALGTALGLANLTTVFLSILLAFAFGYSLTSLPLLRAGFALAAVIPIALASDTASIAVMELVDNAIMLFIPGAMSAGLGTWLFWGSLSFSLVVAGVAAVPVNRWLIARGKGHAAVHNTGVHGGPPIPVVAAVAAVAAIFGTTVLAATALGMDTGGSGGGAHAMGGPEAGANAAAVRGLAVNADGMTLALERTALPRDRATELRFRILGSDSRAVRDFEVEHEKQMHFILARRDMTGFQHLHPELAHDGTWSTPVTLSEPGSYRVFADFKRGGQNETLAADLSVDGSAGYKPLPAAETTAGAKDGYEVRMAGAERSTAGGEAELRFTVLRQGRPVAVEPYLGAGGHLVALREGDLAYLHVHPTGHGAPQKAEPVAFMTEFPSAGRYRLFLQFKHRGQVHTAAFTRNVNSSAGVPGAGPAEAHEGGQHG